jgi:uncharacterized membrane protein YfhO
MTLLYKIGQYAPFGDHSLAAMDADIQYLDFFAFFKDVLQGKNNLSYTFSKTLGGSAIAVYSYYLASPFNFLVLLFEKTQLHTFFDLLVMLKLALAGITMSYYLHARFQKRGVFVIILSLAYVFSQYNIAQASNIMWLDGVYMLPLILLGVYRIINHDYIWKLSVPVALSILFNWYSGGINCVFSGFWFVLEYALYVYQRKNTEFKFYDLIITGLKYLLGMIIGVLCSCILFLPTIGALQNSAKGTLLLDMLKDISFIGALPSTIQSYTYGAKSSYGNVALYCGVFPLIGLLGILLNKTTIEKHIQNILRVTFFATILLFYWKPLYSLFSLFKYVGSYWYRYSYVGIFAIIFIAAYYYLAVDKRKYNILFEYGIFYSLLLILLNYLKPDGNQHTYQTAFIIVVVALLTSLSLNYAEKQNKTYRYAAILLVCITSIDVGYNSFLLMQAYHISDVMDYKSYVTEEAEQVSNLLEYDSDTYRISQTTTRKMYETNLTANYNEALCYNYKSISGYTSSPDGIQNEFLGRLGYRMGDVTMCIVNSSIIGADSLLGVKYVLSAEPVNGLIELSDLGEQNGKKVYLNPFALPMVFTYKSGTTEDTTSKNPFEYQNQLYSTLYGEAVEIYDSVEYEILQTGDIDTDSSEIYRIKIPKGKVALYGNLPWNSYMDATITVNDNFLTAYSRWLSPSVFYIPTNTGDDEVTIEINAESSYDIADIQFYALDLEKFQSITDQIASNSVDSYEIKNGYVKAITHTAENENLYLAIPYDDGWTITVNGEIVEPELFGDCFYSIALESGDNIIEMRYHIQYLKAGILASILGILLILGLSKIEKAIFGSDKVL